MAIAKNDDHKCDCGRTFDYDVMRDSYECPHCHYKLTGIAMLGRVVQSISPKDKYG